MNSASAIPPQVSSIVGASEGQREFSKIVKKKLHTEIKRHKEWGKNFHPDQAMPNHLGTKEKKTVKRWPGKFDETIDRNIHSKGQERQGME